MVNHINNNLWRSSYAAKQGLPQRMFNGQFNTAVLEDQNIPAAYLKELENELGEDKIGDYKGGQNEADAQAFISFDSYRQLKVSEGTWSRAHEELFQKAIKGETIRPRDVVKFFPVIKGQYWGPLANTNQGLPITAFHKYSLFPMIPGVAKGKTMEKVQERMMKEGIDYITFESGSKVGNVTKSGSAVQEDGTGGRRNFDKLYTNQKAHTIESGIIEDKFDENGQPIPYFTKNTIHLQYLKNQLSIYDEPKGNVIFSTQLRKLIEDGLMQQGVPTDFAGTKKEWDSIKSERAKEERSPYYKLLRTYERNLDKLTQLSKDKLLEEMNWESKIVNGKEVLSGDIKNLIAFVKKELTRQDLAQHEIDFIEYDENGNLKKDLSLHLNVERIEKLLNALMVKKLVKQKVNGEGLIQVASTMLEDLATSEGRNFENPTEEDLAKYGSNDLPFYRKGKGPNGQTSAMKVKVALQGDFINLLQAEHLDGNVIGTRQRLNEMIRNEEWLDIGRNREMITMVGVRIPVQGLNSMEFMEVYEFLDPSAGSVIVPPTEIVTKSGADFDVDKMTVMMPNIRKPKYQRNERGIRTKVKGPQMWNWTKEELDQEYQEYLEFQKKLVGLDANEAADLMMMEFMGQTAEELEAEKQQIFQELIDTGEVLSAEQFKKKRLGSKAVENDLIMNIKDILALPTNFKPLVTPNSTDILDPLVDEFKDSARDENISDVVYAEEGEQSRIGPKGNKIMSKTRALEIGYNLGKHSSNNIGKKTLGLGAVDNTYNTMFNRIGAYMNKANYTDKQLADAKALIAESDSGKRVNNAKLREANKIVNEYTTQEILLPHNTMQLEDGSEVISLSDLTDANGDNSISDVINQLINGWVDIAADDFIFDIQGNQEIAPTMLFMVQAGVPIRDAVIMASSPLVKEYVEKQQQASGVLRTKLKKGPADANDARRYALTQMMQNIDPDISINDETGYVTRAGAAEFKSKPNNGKAFSRGQMADAVKNTIKQAKARKAGQKYTPTKLDIDMFKHYLQLEDMAEPIKQVKLTTNVDTSRDVSLFEAQTRLGKLSALEESDRIPSSIITDLKKNSPIGSFFIQGFQLELLGRMFPVRNADYINKYVSENITSREAKKLFGKKDVTVINWKSDLINFIFQNELTHFDLNNITSYKSREFTNDAKDVEKVLLDRGAFVKDGKMYLDKNALIRQYDSQMYATNAYNTEYGLALVNGKVFDRAEQYVQFVLERESLRESFPLKDIQSTVLFREKLNQVNNSKAFTQREDESGPLNQKRKVKYAYELWLRDTALANVYNFNQMFTLKDVNYGARFIRLREAYPELAKSFQLMNALSFDEPKGGSRRNLFLNESKLSADQKNILHENLENLQSFEKVREILPNASVAQVREINDFFSKMPIVAFMQSGMNTKSQFALTQFISQDKMMMILEGPMKKFNKKLNAAKQGIDKGTGIIEYLDRFTSMFKSKNLETMRKTRVRGKDYSQNLTLNSSTLQKDAQFDKLQTPDLLVEDFEYDGDTGTQVKAQPTESVDTINIFAGTNENAELSNFAERPFTMRYADPMSGKILEYSYNNVEAAFQSTKLNISEVTTLNQEIGEKLKTATGKEAKALGRKIQELDVATWDKESPRVMKDLIKASFEQNPDALQKLLDTGNATLTHTQDKSKWGTLFPQILMEVRQELSGKSKTYDGLLDIKNLKDNQDTVFGSNQFGFHGGGTAGILYANDSRAYKKQDIKGKGLRVEVGKARGFQTGTEGSSYAIQTVTDWKLPMDNPKRQVPKDQIVSQIREMYDYYRNNPTREAFVLYTTQGRNLNGYTPQDMADMFTAAGPAPVNVIFNTELKALMPSEKGTIEDNQVEGTIEGTDYKAEIYTSQFIANWSQAESMLTKNPNNIYLYDAPLKQEPAKTGRTGNQKLHGLANNAVGITTKMSYSMETGKVRSDIVRDVDGKINPDIKSAIDANIENIRAHIAQGQEVRFDADGYGQEMLESDKNGNQYAPQTFVYLSEQLYKNFGFVNPNYLSNSVNNAVVKESVARLQETQDITDKEINRTIDDYSNHDVLEFMKNCM